MRGLQAPNLQQLEAYNVNVDGQPEVIWQPLFDFQTYPAAGFTNLRFFNVGAGSGGKTFDDTNLESPAGSLPVPVNMAITSVEVVFFPGSVQGREVAGGAVLNQNWNDVQAVGEAGHISLVIGSKEYLLDGPLGRFPPTFRQAGVAGITGTPAAAAIQGVDYAVWAGPVYNIVPLRLISQQNFRVDVNFANGVVALPSTVDGRIGVRLNGFRYRLAQ